MRKEIIFGIAKFSNGKMLTSRNFVNAEAFSRWANKLFLKDESVVIQEYRNFEKYSVWSA